MDFKFQRLICKGLLTEKVRKLVRVKENSSYSGSIHMVTSLYFFITFIHANNQLEFFVGPEWFYVNIFIWFLSQKIELPTVVASSLNNFVQEQTNEMTTGDVSVIVDMMGSLASSSKQGADGKATEKFTKVC